MEHDDQSNMPATFTVLALVKELAGLLRLKVTPFACIFAAILVLIILYTMKMDGAAHEVKQWIVLGGLAVIAISLLFMGISGKLPFSYKIENPKEKEPAAEEEESSQQKRRVKL